MSWAHPEAPALVANVPGEPIEAAKAARRRLSDRRNV